MQQNAKDASQAFEDVRIGVQADDFINSSLGQAIAAKAQKEEIDAAHALIYKADPNNPAEIMQLQMQARIAQSSIRWLVGLIENGQISEQYIKELEGSTNDH